MPKSRILYIVTASISFLGVAFTLASYVTFQHLALNNRTASWISELFLSLGAGIIQSVILFLFLEQLYARRERKEELSRRQAERSHDLSLRREELQVQCIAEFRRASKEEDRQVVADKMRSLDLFRGADLSGLDFSKLRLDQADFTDARMVRMSFVDTDLEGSCLSGADLSQSFLLRVKMKRCKAESTSFVRCDASDVDFDESCLRNASFQFGQFPQARFDDADLSGALLDRARFEGASLVRTNLSGASLVSTEFSGARLTDAEITAGALQKAVLSTSTVMPNGIYWRMEAENPKQDI